MRILFWVPYPTEGASNRYRVEQYLSYLKENGIRYALRPFWNSAAFRVLYKRGHYFKKVYFFILGTLFRIFDIFQIFRYDIIFIHRETYPVGGAFFETILSTLKKNFIFDFDDAIFLPTSSRPNRFIERFKDPNKVAKIIEMSDYVIVSTKYLADFALKYNRNVCIIPTSIDTDKFYPIMNNNRQSEEIVIGWMGSITTLDFLNTLQNTFIQIAKRFPHTIFKIIGGHFSIQGFSCIVNKEWSLNEEIEDLRTFDIGIMPVPDNEWTRGKCGFKGILYMSMGIPTVSSLVEANKEIIIDGVNGFLADTEKDWVRKLALLIENQELRQRMGLAGRKTIEERFSVKVNAPKILKIINTVYQIKKREE